MKKYKILEHKADLKIKIFGKRKEEFFENAMIGMFESAGYEIEKKSKEILRELYLRYTKDETFLIDFLNRIIYLSETKKEVYYRIDSMKINGDKIKYILAGKKLKRMNINIKAATYHNFEVKKRGSIFQAVILFDV